MKTYILASKNKHKAEEIKRILGSGYEIKTLDDVGLSDFEMIEDGTSFEENAVKKASQVFEKLHLPVIADDSGLCVDHLGGRPGIYTARFAGENASDDENINKLLTELDGVPAQERGAKFVCVIALIEGNEAKPRLYRGECTGYITEKRHGTSGFGYDPVFFYPGKNLTLAELGADEKNKISHRFKALKLLSNDINS